MPFVKFDRRLRIDEIIASGEATPGDLCYKYYREMVDRWKTEPRWSTAHEIRKAMYFGDWAESENTDHFTAKELAWNVFFHIWVMKYELKQRELNGDIF